MKGKILLLLFAIVALMFTPILSVSASLVEVDTSAVVYNVIDGDTFDAFPVGRVRLADIDAPERGDPGYIEAKDYLSLLIYNKRVYLDVDDVYVMDTYNRLVCLVYVRYNSTHLLNVNRALLAKNLAVISDYPNEFDPYTWTLFVYYPTTFLPETYDELLQVYLGLKSDYQKLNASYYELKANYDKLKIDYEKLLEDYNTLIATYYKLKADYDSLKAIYDKLMADYNSLQTSYSTSYDKLKADYDSLQTSYNKLKTDYTSLQTSYTSLKSDYDSLKATYEKLASDYKGLQATHSSLKSDYDKLTAEYNKLKSDYDGLKSEHESTVRQLGTNTNFMYVFIVTTVAFIATKVYFARKKLKTT